MLFRRKSFHTNYPIKMLFARDLFRLSCAEEDELLRLWSEWERMQPEVLIKCFNANNGGITQISDNVNFSSVSPVNDPRTIDIRSFEVCDAN